MSEKKDHEITLTWSRSQLIKFGIGFIGINILFMTAMFILSLFPFMSIEPFSEKWFQLLYMTIGALYLFPCHIILFKKVDNYTRKRFGQVISTIGILSGSFLIIYTLTGVYDSNYRNAEREKREIANAERLHFEDLYSQGKYEVLLQESQNVQLDPGVIYSRNFLYYRALALCQLDKIDEAKDVFHHIADAAPDPFHKQLTNIINSLNEGIEREMELISTINSSSPVIPKYIGMMHLASVYEHQLYNDKKALQTYEQMAQIAQTEFEITYAKDKIKELREGKVTFDY